MYESFKKHYTQMTDKEIKYIRNIIDSKKLYRFTNHMLNKKKIRHIKEKDILDVFLDYDIIEFHRKGRDCRVLIRGNKVCNGKNICASIDLYTGHIVTVYANYNSDNHKKVNMNNYNLNGVNLVDYIKLFI